MSKIKDTQRGFSTVELVVVLLVVALISTVGFVVYKNQSDQASTKQDVAKTSEIIQKSAPDKSDATESRVSVVTKESLQGISLNAPRCGSQAVISQGPPGELDLKYTKPENWSILDTYPNGVTYKSADFKSEQGFKNISTGAILTLSVQLKCTLGDGLVKDMESSAQNSTMNLETQLVFIKIADYYGVKFKHNTGENRNNHDVVLLFKDNKVYTIAEQFNYSAANPYPHVVDTLLNTIY